uniref:Uncharacterized protein n=1 Tax=Anser cygnoides TaxID=8845 RepID=A0A8B9DJG6_ANSCY
IELHQEQEQLQLYRTCICHLERHKKQLFFRDSWEK